MPTATGKRFLVASLLIAVALAVFANVVAARLLHVNTNSLVTVFTAVVVGVVLGLSFLKPRAPRMRAQGFRVEERRVIESRKRRP